MQCSYDSRGNSVPTILLMMQRRLYEQGGLRVWLFSGEPDYYFTFLMRCSFLQTNNCHFICNVQAEGIFRINAENSQEEIVRDRLNRGIVPYGIDVHCLAGLIKVSFFLSFNLCDSVDITSFLSIYTVLRELLLVLIIFIGGNLSHNRLHLQMEPNLLFCHKFICLF
jgi:hypothetical protein